MGADGLQPFWALGLGSVVVEAIVNIVKNIEAKNSNWRYWASLGLGLVLGPVIAIAYDIDLFSVAGLEGRWDWVVYLGAFLTGIIMGRGGNVVQDIIDRLNSWRQ